MNVPFLVYTENIQGCLASTTEHRWLTYSRRRTGRAVEVQVSEALPPPELGLVAHEGASGGRGEVFDEVHAVGTANARLEVESSS